MRVLVAPDKFKGTLTAAEAARAIATGWRRARPGDILDEVPMGDGGEGTLDALIAALGGELRRVEVSGPLGESVAAEFGIAPSPADGGLVGVIEMARASGLQLLSEDRQNPLLTTTRGTGELVLAALEAGATTLVLCIGGSGTNDGGAGMAQALGAHLRAADGTEIADGGAALLDLATIDTAAMDPRLRSITVLVACDVDNPLCGATGAAAVYGPQKGASPDDVQLLDSALGHFAAVVQRDLGIDIRDIPGAGAAGGLGGGSVAFLGARLRPGIDVVAEAVGLEARVAAADYVITGEGKFDEQSLFGKTAIGVVRAAQAAGKPAAILCGIAETTLDDIEIRSLVEAVGETRALTDARSALEDLAEALSNARGGN